MAENPQPNADRLAAATDRAAPIRFNAAAGGFLRRYLMIAPAALALERSMECDILAQQQWQRPILDVGCGDGIFVQQLFKDAIDTGIDKDPTEVDLARKCNAYRELIVCRADKIPKPDASYNTVFSNSVLEHIPDLASVLKEIHRILAPGGRLYITIPTDRVELATAVARALSALGLHSLSVRFRKFYNRFWRHYHAYNEQKWRELLEAAGFAIVQELPYVPDGLSTLCDILTPVALPSFFFRRIWGRWISSSRLRSLTSGVIHAVLASVVTNLKRRKGGCLVFYALTKRSGM
ncbi:MAG: methyltransferase domain-containing protein [Alphaproteobacteria bacterium]|nr:methyltransferase domain-containing protein [Alphaproteobacteria bacterium]